jgi:hypothetical protein
MLQDSARYKDAHIFDGFRFARAKAQLQPCAEVPGDQKEARLTHVSPDWPIWGLGNMSW